jgi:hypothetical protein
VQELQAEQLGLRQLQAMPIVTDGAPPAMLHALRRDGHPQEKKQGTAADAMLLAALSIA